MISLMVCSAGHGEDKPTASPAAAEKLEACQLGMIQQLHSLGGVYLAGQPSPEDFQLVKERGIRTVVNLRLADELDWDEAARVQGLGLEYRHIPFQAPASLTDEVFDQVRKLLNDADKQPLMLHCGSANRVGALWLAHRVLDRGLTVEAALVEAKTIGLRLPAYEEKAKDYIQRMRKK